jgi:histidinol-phosphate aminotransferase
LEGDHMYYLDPKVKNIYRIFDQNERKDYLRFDLNENPGGVSGDFTFYRSFS